MTAEVAQQRAEAMGLTAKTLPFSEKERQDPARLRMACLATVGTALCVWLTVFSLLALLPALACAAVLLKSAPAMRRYFFAFSPRNAFPRNLPAFARWAALYSGVMLTMIVLPTTLSVATRLGLWVTLAAACLLFPLLKARARAARVWHP